MPEEVAIQEPALLVRLTTRGGTKKDPYALGSDELRERTLCCWRLNPKRVEKAEYAFALSDGCVLAVYSLQGSELGHKDEKGVQRRRLIGKLAPETVREKYVRKSVKHYLRKGNVSPVCYVGV